MKKAIMTLLLFGGFAVTQMSAQSCSTTNTACCTNGKTATAANATKACTPEQLKMCTPEQIKAYCTLGMAAKSEKATKTAVAVKPEKVAISTSKTIAAAEK